MESVLNFVDVDLIYFCVAHIIYYPLHYYCDAFSNYDFFIVADVAIVQIKSIIKAVVKTTKRLVDDDMD